MYDRVYESVCSALVTGFDISEEITPESSLTEDFGLDSLDYIDLVCMLEDSFEVHLDPKSNEYEGLFAEADTVKAFATAFTKIVNDKKGLKDG